MCAGAILNARVGRVYYGARDRAMGAVGGVSNLLLEVNPIAPLWWAASWQRSVLPSSNGFSVGCVPGIKKYSATERNFFRNFILL